VRSEPVAPEAPAEAVHNILPLRRKRA